MTYDKILFSFASCSFGTNNVDCVYFFIVFACLYGLFMLYLRLFMSSTIDSHNTDMDIRSLLRSELLRSIDRKSVIVSSGLSKQGDRLYGYVDALTRAGAGCLRYGESDGVVYVFNGRIWLPMSERSVYDRTVCLVARDVLLSCCGSISRSDLMSGERRLGSAITDGAMCSEFSVSSSYIGFRNGIWDFSNPLEPVRHGFSERLPVTQLRDYDYDPGARCPMWEGFLSNALSSSDMGVLQMFFGLGVKPRTELGRSVEKMLWMVGSGGNGKSTCLDVLEHVYGEGLFSHASLPTLLDGNVLNRMLGTSPIIGKRYNRCDEIQMSDITKKTDLLKRLCSADHVEYRRIKGNAMSSNEIPFFVFSMNKVPSSRSTDAALLRRLLIVRFGYSVRAEDTDTGLYGRLCGESSGIWNWCIEGYRRLVDSGFLFPRTGDNDAEQRRMMLSSGQQMEVWLQDEGLTAMGRKRMQRPYKVLLGVLYDRYRSWCEEAGLECEYDNPRSFAQRMGAGAYGRPGLGYTKKRSSAGMYFEVYSDKKIEYGV